MGLRRRARVHRRAVRHLLRPDAGLRGARLPRELDRRGAAGREARRRLLHAGPRGRVADYGQLHARLLRRLDARARARARLPQHQPGGTHADPAADAHDAGRDREHLLRDDLPRGRAARGRRLAYGAARDPRGLAAGVRSGRRRHPQPLPLREPCVRGAPRARALSGGAVRPDGGGPARDVRRRRRSRSTATCGR